MATFRAENVGFLFALVTEGFIPYSPGRVSHPTLRGRKARSARHRAWCAAVRAARDAGLGYLCVTDTYEHWHPFASRPITSRSEGPIADALRRAEALRRIAPKLPADLQELALLISEDVRMLARDVSMRHVDVKELLRLQAEMFTARSQLVYSLEHCSQADWETDQEHLNTAAKTYRKALALHNIPEER